MVAHEKVKAFLIHAVQGVFEKHCRKILADKMQPSDRQVFCKIFDFAYGVQFENIFGARMRLEGFGV